MGADDGGGEGTALPLTDDTVGPDGHTNGWFGLDGSGRAFAAPSYLSRHSRQARAEEQPAPNVVNFQERRATGAEAQAVVILAPARELSANIMTVSGRIVENR
jgi:hypothetical protein